MLRATTACNVPFLIWPDGSAPAALASLLFDHLEPQIIGKHSVSRLCYLFAQLDLLSSDFSSFSSLLFSDSSHLCSSSVHIIGSLTSKLPSVIISWDLMGQLTQVSATICHLSTVPSMLPGSQCRQLGSADLVGQPGSTKVWSLGTTAFAKTC